MLIVAPTEGFDSLVSLAYADAHALKMGHADWATKHEAERETALRRGTLYVLSRNVKPEYLYPVHDRVAQATCEAAVLHFAGELYQSSIGASAVMREQVGEIAVSYGFPANGGRARFPVIDDLLRGLAVGGWQIGIVRA